MGVIREDGDEFVLEVAAKVQFKNMLKNYRET